MIQAVANTVRSATNAPAIKRGMKQIVLSIQTNIRTREVAQTEAALEKMVAA